MTYGSLDSYLAALIFLAFCAAIYYGLPFLERRGR